MLPLKTYKLQFSSLCPGPNLENFDVQERFIDSIDVKNLPLEALLFQAGYLTIKDINDKLQIRMYRLDYPNFEVKQAFLAQLLTYFTEITEESNYIYQLIELFEEYSHLRVSMFYLDCSLKHDSLEPMLRHSLDNQQTKPLEKYRNHVSCKIPDLPHLNVKI